MSSKNTAVFGIYATPATAEAAVDHLLAKGFANSAISVLLPDNDSTRAFAHEKSTKAPEGTATGVATGGIIGGTIGLLNRSGPSRHSRSRAIHRSWPDCGNTGGPGGRRSCRRHSRGSRGYGYSRI